MKISTSLPSATIQSKNTDSVNSETGQQARTQQNSLSQLGKMVSTSDKQGLIELGKLALGNSTLNLWSKQGLELSEESLIAAGKAFQEGFKQITDQRGTETAGSKVSINSHQVVMDNQQNLPQWFIDEYDDLLQNLSDDAHRNAFQQGDHFFAKSENFENPALRNYQSVSNYG